MRGPVGPWPGHEYPEDAIPEPEPVPGPRVGDVYIFARECMGNPPGTRAVCYEEYDLGAGPAGSFIFGNGAYDGFSPGDIKLFGGQLVEPAALEARYTFTNVMVLARDFERGVFDRALHRKGVPR